jgi:hypothetical protein
MERKKGTMCNTTNIIPLKQAFSSKKPFASSMIASAWKGMRLQREVFAPGGGLFLGG